MKNKWIGGLIALLTLVFYAGYSIPESPDTISGLIKDTDNIPIGNAEISIFDGFSIRNIKSDSNGMYNISQLPVSPDLYAVIFFTKDGYVPSIINVKIREQDKADYPVTMKKAQSEKNGYIAGVIYQPIKGGKIKYQSGIYNFGKGRRVWLEKNGGITETMSNTDGHFIFEVPAGRYRLSAEGSREKADVEVVKGETVIKNTRSGIVLVD